MSSFLDLALYTELAFAVGHVLLNDKMILHAAIAVDSYLTGYHGCTLKKPTHLLTPSHCTTQHFIKVSSGNSDKRDFGF